MKEFQKIPKTLTKQSMFDNIFYNPVYFLTGFAHAYSLLRTFGHSAKMHLYVINRVMTMQGDIQEDK